jgi:hypothetical protein
MIIRTSLIAGALLSIVMIFSTSCNKCKLSDGNQNTGLILEDAIIYPSAGYISSNYGGKLHITGSNTYAPDFKVSFDGGATIIPVDYSQYSILSNAVSVDCEASINKDVTYNSTLDVYTYSVTGETCSSCKSAQGYYLENYVLVNAIPDGANIIYDVNVTQK